MSTFPLNDFVRQMHAIVAAYMRIYGETEVEDRERLPFDVRVVGTEGVPRVELYRPQSGETVGAVDKVPKGWRVDWLSNPSVLAELAETVRERGVALHPQSTPEPVPVPISTTRRVNPQASDITGTLHELDDPFYGEMSA